jgi:hypothetical protein
MKISSHKELQISQEFFKKRILCGKTIDEELENLPNANMTWFVLIMGKY